MDRHKNNIHPSELHLAASSIPEDFDIDKFAEEWRNHKSQIIYTDPDNYIYAVSDLCKELIASGISEKYNVSIIENQFLEPGQMMIAGPIVDKHKKERRNHLKQAIESCGYKVDNMDAILEGKGHLEIKYRKEPNQIEYFLRDKEKPCLYLLMKESPLPFGELKTYENNSVEVNEGYFD